MNNSDSALQKSIIAELNFDPSVKEAEIGVEVKDGTVTLSGQVSSSLQKWHAERAAQRIPGIKAIVVDMAVILPGGIQLTDTDIAHAVEHILRWKSFLPADAVKVIVENGWVKLSGRVDWEYQRQATIDAIRHLKGVIGVEDLLTLNASVPVAVNQADIEAAIKRRTTSGASNVSVSINGSEVILTGNVNTWTERDLATHSAWCTPGVLNVTDHMHFTD